MKFPNLRWRPMLALKTLLPYLHFKHGSLQCSSFFSTGVNIILLNYFKYRVYFRQFYSIVHIISYLKLVVNFIGLRRKHCFVNSICITKLDFQVNVNLKYSNMQNLAIVCEYLVPIARVDEAVFCIEGSVIRTLSHALEAMLTSRDWDAVGTEWFIKN